MSLLLLALQFSRYYKNCLIYLVNNSCRSEIEAGKGKGKGSCFAVEMLLPLQNSKAGLAKDSCWYQSFLYKVL